MAKALRKKPTKIPKIAKRDKLAPFITDQFGNRQYRVSQVYDLMAASDAKVIILRGGRGSTKSHSKGQDIIRKLTSRDSYKALILRKTMPALKASTLEVFVDLLKEYGIYKTPSGVQHNKVDHIFTYRNNIVRFGGMDESDKLLSTNYNEIWMEEAHEFIYDNFMTLISGLRGVIKDSDKAREPKIRNSITLSFNPRSSAQWIREKIEQSGLYDIEIITSTKDDNPFAEDDYIQDIENIKYQSKYYWKIFGEGEYADTTDNMLQKRLLPVNAYPLYFDDIVYGMDFGFTDPTCLYRLGIKQDKRTGYIGKLFVDEIFYQSNLFPTDIVGLMEENNVSKDYVIYADHDPEKINLISDAGYNITGVPDKKGSFKPSIDILRLTNTYTSNENPNLNREWPNYRNKLDKENRPIDYEPENNAEDHAISAIRYGTYGWMHLNAPGIGVL